MYKRKVRVLFLSLGSAACGRMAEDYARREGSAWLEARAACFSARGVEPSVPYFLSEEEMPGALAWADLVVTLGGCEDEFDLPLPPGVQRRHWALPEPGAREEIERRVAGIIGGIRLLARSDDGPGEGG